MIRRIGIAWRLVLILVVALAIAQVAQIAAYWAEHGAGLRSVGGAILPAQVAATVRLADASPAAARDDIVAAASGAGLRVAFRDGFDPASMSGRRVPLLERAVRIRIPDPDREVHAVYSRRDADPGDDAGSAADDERRDARTLRIAVALRSGGWLDVVAIGDLSVRLFGVPVGFLAGLFGLLVAAVAIVAIAREARPLVRLAHAVDRLGTDLRGPPLEETGAPEVGDLVRALNRMQARIAALVENRTLILGAIAHDLGTLLTRLRLRLELLPADPARDRAVADVVEMGRLVADSLAFARASDDRDHEPLDLARLVEETIAERIDLGAPVRRGAVAAAAPVRGSRLGLVRLLGNLVDNALRHAGDAEVSLRADGPAWEIEVADHGRGIAPADRDRIFEPFLRLDASRNRATGGSGLGLTIARQIAEAHRGTVSVRDRADGAAGAVFVVRLPAA